MTEVVVTSFSAAGEELYGRRMVQTFRRFWPADRELVVYVDAPTRITAATVRSTADLGDWMVCKQRWTGKPWLRGLSTPEHPYHKPYLYQRDVMRFAVKFFVMRDAALKLERGILTWLDGDTVTTAPVPPTLTADLLGDADLAYLGRGSQHPENGYIGFRIPEALPLLEWACETYTSDRVLAIDNGWTDCHVLREALKAVPVKARDLTSHLYAGKSNIWPVSPLAPYVTHNKGKNKRDANLKRLMVTA